MKIQDGDTLLFIGDSITDCGRKMPEGEGRCEDLGQGYVVYVQAQLMAYHPDRTIRVVNKGISGNTVRNLRDRWQEDVMALQPDWLSIMIGINDVWRHFDNPACVQKHVPLEEYEATLDKLVKLSLAMAKGIVLMTPYYIEPNTGDAMRNMMDRYGAVVKKIAEKYGTYFVDTQAAFDKVLVHVHSNTLSCDRVHPQFTGHAIIGRAFLEVIGF